MDCRTPWAQAGGLLLVPGLGEIADNPPLLLQMSYLFGPEVEDYRYTLTAARRRCTQAVPEIFMVSNIAPVNRSRRGGPIRRSPPTAVCRCSIPTARAGTPTRAIAGRRPTSRCSMP